LGVGKERGCHKRRKAPKIQKDEKELREKPRRRSRERGKRERNNWEGGKVKAHQISKPVATRRRQPKPHNKTRKGESPQQVRKTACSYPKAKKGVKRGVGHKKLARVFPNGA